MAKVIHWKYTGRVFSMDEFMFIQIPLGSEVGYATLKDGSASMNVVLHPDPERAKAGIWAEIVSASDKTST